MEEKALRDFRRFAECLELYIFCAIYFFSVNLTRPSVTAKSKMDLTSHLAQLQLKALETEPFKNIYDSNV